VTAPGHVIKCGQYFGPSEAARAIRYSADDWLSVINLSLLVLRHLEKTNAGDFRLIGISEMRGFGMRSAKVNFKVNVNL
jgi:hypothetical protein